MKGVSQSFIDRADSAAFYEAWVGAVLARAGLYTVHHPFKIDGKDHSQSYDLDVCDEWTWTGQVYAGGLDGTRVEVKSLNLTFTCPEDYPFPEVLLCSQSSFNKKWPGRDYTMRDFLLVSRKTGSIVWVPTMTQVGVKTVTDKTRNETYQAMTVNQSALSPLQDFVETFNEH